MKVTYIGRNGRLSVDIEGKTQKDIFQELSSFQEVFEINTCGACLEENALRFVVRSVDDNDFYELHCTNSECRARLAFGQHKKGDSLFPVRKDKDGKWLPKSGWTKWNPETKKEE